MTPPARAREFIEVFREWACAQPDILAAALVGSHARASATESSDVDLVLITRQPASYLERHGWTRQFGSVQREAIEAYGLLTSLRVHYTDGLEVEFGITDERWCAVPLDEGTRQVMAGGLRILFERDALLSRHLVEDQALPFEGRRPEGRGPEGPAAVTD
jgi:predicted nucleotidyltransferase